MQQFECHVKDSRQLCIPRSCVHSPVRTRRYCSELGHSEIVQLLLDRGANVFATTDTKSTALYFAALQSHESIVEILSNQGGTKLLEMATVEGRTPLLAAACKGHASVVKCSLDKGLISRPHKC